MIHEFEVTNRQEYAILRDYYFENKYIKGILFLLENEKNGEIIERILPFELANNKYEWEKLKKGEIKYQASGVERGEYSKLIIETGVLRIEKDSSFGDKKEYNLTAKKYRYILNGNYK